MSITIKKIISLGRDFARWISGPDVFIHIHSTPNERLIHEVKLRTPWLSDSELCELMNCLEVEQVNRLAQQYGYNDKQAYLNG